MEPRGLFWANSDILHPRIRLFHVSSKGEKPPGSSLNTPNEDPPKAWGCLGVFLEYFWSMCSGSRGRDGETFPAACAALISPFGIIHGDIKASETVPSWRVWPRQIQRIPWADGRERGGQTRLMVVLAHMAFRPLFGIPLRWSNYSGIKGMKIKMVSARFDLGSF